MDSVKKRQEEKQKKQAKEAALQDICKQSLNEDKKKAAASKRGQKGNNNNNTEPSTPTSLTNSDGGSQGSGNSSSSSGGRGGIRLRAPRHPGYMPSKALPDQPSPMKELEDEDEEQQAGPDRQGSGTSQEAGPSEIPAHHAQLYQLYGKQADYFLHPKPTQPAAAQRRMTQPRLKNHRGHIGAGELWDTLRKDSTSKLIRNDRRFPQELKSAFSSFVRERLTKHSRPVERSFCATEDVPDIKRLMDQSKLRRTRLYRHKTELMYRSSVTNRDRTTILLHNSPLPDITETGQADSISRYLPSWMDDQSVSVSDLSEAEYMKWINAAREDQDEDDFDDNYKENIRHSAHSRQLSESANELQSIWQAISARNKKARMPRYQFLTEKEAESEGNFTQKFLEEKEQREKPQAHHVSKSYSALELSNPTSSYSAVSSKDRGRSAHTAMQLNRYQSDWQPLSMAALVEYKKQMDTEGQGEFEHGRMKMWPAVASSVS